MQDRTFSSSHPPIATPPRNGTTGLEALDDAPDQTSSSSPVPVSQAPDEHGVPDTPLSSLKETFDEHKGKLAIGAAAMLGLIVYYQWGEKSLAKEDPEEYERLQRIKEGVRHADDRRQTLRRSDDTPSSPDRS